MDALERAFSQIEHSRGVLQNGMPVCAARVPGLKSASLQIWARTGSACEGEFCFGGISHLAEHMFFKGFGGKNAFEISGILRDMGAEMNAYTSYTRTVFYADLPAENLERAFEYLGEFISKPNFLPEDFESERDVILREIDMCLDEPSDANFDAFASRAFAGTEFESPIIGRRAVFEKITLDDLKSYVSRKYTAQNMFLCAVSSRSPKEIMKLAQKHFGKVPEGFREPAPTACGGFCGSRKSVFTKFESPRARQIEGFELPKGYFENPALWDFVAYLLAGSRNSVLQKSLKYGRGILEDVSSEIFSDALIPWLLVDFSSSANAAGEADAAVLSEIRRAQSGGFDESLLQKFAASCRLALADTLKNSSELAAKMGELEMRGADLGGMLKYLREAESLRYGDALSALKSVDIEKSARALCAPRNVLAAPARRRAKAESSLELIGLSNGAKIVLNKIPNCPKTHFRLASLMGLWSLEAADRGLHGLSAAMLSKGAGDMRESGIADFAESNGINFSSGGGNNTVNIFSESLPENWQKAFMLLRDAAKSARFDADAFGRERDILASQIEEDLDDPLERALFCARKKFFGRGALAVSSDGELPALRGASAKKCAKIASGFFPAGASVLCVCGDFEKSAVLDSAGEFMESLPNLRVEPPKAVEPVGLGGKFSARGGFAQAAALSIFKAPGVLDERGDLLSEIASEILGGSSGLVFELAREKLALAYSAGAAGVAGLSSGALYFYALTKRKNLGRIREVFLLCAEKMRAGDFDGRRVLQAAQAIKARLAFSASDAGSSAMRLALDALFGRDLRADAALRYGGLSKPDILEFSEKYLGECMEFSLE